jgi:hypothetical protein
MSRPIYVPADLCPDRCEELYQPVLLWNRKPLSSSYDLATRYAVIRKLTSGQYRLYSRKKDPKTGKRRNLGTFGTRKEAEAHERAVQYFKRRG